MNLVERMKRTQKTVDLWKGRPFKEGTGDCIQLVLAHLRHMGVKVKVPKYRDTKSAAGVLRKLGFRTLGEAMDAHATRIEPSRVMIGDVVESLGTNGFSGLMIAVGNGRTLGFHEDIPHADILQPLLMTGAWRIGA